MKFGNKLSKLRKEKNLSQEQLADKLEVSRQAVSKWESGQSYPEMDKIIILCKLFDCSIDELINDKEQINQDKIKRNLKNYVDEFLNFITKTFNMFWSMTFKQKISCLFQMGILVLVLIIFYLILGSILSSLYNGIFGFLPYVIYSFLRGIFKFVYTLIGIVICTLITVHIFKIRFLDYFVTIEDKEAIEKEIETPIDEEMTYKEKKREKIIIRDPKHSSFGIFKILSRLLNLFLKVCALTTLCFLAISFIMIIFMFIVNLFYLKYGMIFVGFLISLLGVILICSIIGDLLYRFIFSFKQKLIMFFWISFISLVMVGAGLGISFVSYSKFDFVKEENEKEILNKVTRETIKLTDKEKNSITFDCDENHYCSSIEYEVNENLKDIVLVDIKHNDKYDYYFRYYTYYEADEIIHIYSVLPALRDYNLMQIYNKLIEDLKNKVTRDYSKYPRVELKVYSSSENIEKIKNNLNLF